jgi:putative restriction endonuclease
MPRPTKPQLLERVEEGFRSGGWNFLYVSNPGDHPARYRVYRDAAGIMVRVYIWNISHGGGAARAADEYRIQVTGVPQNTFQPEIGGKTLILGWWANDEIFAGFDYRRHSAHLGFSPSFQVGRAALQAAVTNRFAAHRKNTGELVITFQPDFIGTYAQNLEELHDTGAVPAEVALLGRIATAPQGVAEAEITAGVAQPRRYAVTETRRALRALDFSARVLSAYGHRCAMCGVQLKLLEGAHILPVAEPESTDETSNGVSLCVLHHRAYDRSLVTFGPDYAIQVSAKKVAELQAADKAGGLQRFRDNLREVIQVPAEQASRPKPEFVERANALRGWR